MNSFNYIGISPVRDEEQNISKTIDSLVAQTIRPLKWVFVDDGSVDQTGRIIDNAANVHDWILVVHRSNRGFRLAGEGVMAAFYDGYRLIENEPWNYLVKLDGDLSFSKDYFENCLKEFVFRPSIGIAGGTICNVVGDHLEQESKIDPQFHVRGATKIYRRECWKAINGLILAPGWDTLDEVKANMLGWETCTFPGIKLVHHRPAGNAYGSWKNWVKNGRANYVVGYHPLFMFLKCLSRIFTKPYLLAGCGLLVGFVTGYLKRVPQIDEHEVIRYFRKQQLNRLFRKKSLWDFKSQPNSIRQ
jgi:poly-beta-1,6-N-acetyl-D-glucosamine synthase